MRAERTSEMVLYSSHVTLPPKCLITQLRKLEEQKVGERKAPLKEMANNKPFPEDRRTFITEVERQLRFK